MLSGSFAMAYYSQPRMTRDLDFVVELNNASGPTVYEVFKDSPVVSVNGARPNSFRCSQLLS
jgi:hypothetical protein